MWNSTIFWKMMLLVVGLSSSLALGFSLITSHWVREFELRRATESLRYLGITIQAQVEPSLDSWKSLPAFKRSFSPQINISAFDDNGSLLAGEAWPGGNATEQPDFRNALLGEESSGLSAVSGRSILHVTMPLKTMSLGRNDRAVGVLRITEDLADFDSHLSNLNLRIAWFTLAATAVAVVIMFRVIDQVVRPLTLLTQRAQAVVGDDRQQLLTFDAADELGVLGNAFNQMQVKLARRVEELKENTERLATVLGSMVEGVIAVSPDEVILTANEASRRLLDMTVADPIGRSLLEVTRSLPVHTAVVESLNSPTPVQREFDVPGTQRRIIALRANRLPGDPSPGVVVVLHDISELRRLENLRREFVANVSHELKTPLASIKAYAETLKLGALNDPEHRVIFVTRIEEQAERLHQLILDLLQIARVESGQEAFEIDDVELSDAVQECLDRYANVAAAKQIDLRSHPATTRVVVRADEEGLRTMVSNLIDNALKYTPERGQVTVSWHHDHSAAVLKVSDTGIGIAEKDQSRIFERFYRADKARSREVGGTGLGLSIVKHLAHAFGGSVSVASAPQKGSTFQIRLPLGNQAKLLPLANSSS